MPAYIHHNHSRWKPPFAMRVSTEDSKMDGRCSVKASAEIRVSIATLRRVASRATTLHLMRNAPQMISNQRLSTYYRSFRERFYSELRFRKLRGNLWELFSFAIKYLTYTVINFSRFYPIINVLMFLKKNKVLFFINVNARVTYVKIHIQDRSLEKLRFVSRVYL